MKKFFKFTTVVVLAFFVSSCATGTSAKVWSGGQSIEQARAERYNGPKARLAVVKFIDKSAKAGGAFGSGMSDMLTTALFRSNRFILLDRADLDAVISEQDFAAAGRISAETGAKIGELEGADLLVMGAITAFEPDKIGVGGFFVGALTLGASIFLASRDDNVPIGAVLYKESYIAIDVKVVDAVTGRVVAVSSVEGKSQNWGGGIIGAVGGGWSRVPVGFGGFASSGVEEALQACLNAAVKDIASKTPAQYYRVSDTLDTTPVGLILLPQPVLFEGSTPVGIKTPKAMVVRGPDDYKKLLFELGEPYDSAPKFDWSKNILLAAFAGEKEDRGHRIAIEKVIQRSDALEVHIRQAPPPVANKGDEVVRGPDWPFDVVSIDVATDKPVRFVWD